MYIIVVTSDGYVNVEIRLLCAARSVVRAYVHGLGLSIISFDVRSKSTKIRVEDGCKYKVWSIYAVA